MSNMQTPEIPEVWLNVAGWEGYYQVSNRGRVKSCLRWVVRRDMQVVILSGKIHELKLSSGDRKYGSGKRLYATLSKNGIVRNCLVNRLVAEAFIPNPDNKLEVNHINGDPMDNTALNLEWNTKRENMDHAKKMGLIGRSWSNLRHVVRCVELGITTIGVGRMVEALKERGYSPDGPRVLRCIQGKGESCNGLTFRSVRISELDGMSNEAFSTRLGIPS